MEPNDFVSSRGTIISSIDPCFLRDLEVRRFDEPACIRGHSGGEKLPIVNRPRQPKSRWPTARPSTEGGGGGQPGGRDERRIRRRGAEIGRAHVGTPVTNAHLGCSLPSKKKNDCNYIHLNHNSY